MAYVDGYVLAVPKAKLDEYWKMATLGRKVWMEHGALTYCEALADDVPYGETTSFPRAVQATEDEVASFNFITSRDRPPRHRGRISGRRRGRVARQRGHGPRRLGSGCAVGGELRRGVQLGRDR